MYAMMRKRKRNAMEFAVGCREDANSLNKSVFGQTHTSCVQMRVKWAWSIRGTLAKPLGARIRAGVEGIGGMCHTSTSRPLRSVRVAVSQPAVRI